MSVRERIEDALREQAAELGYELRGTFWDDEDYSILDAEGRTRHVLKTLNQVSEALAHIERRVRP